MNNRIFKFRAWDKHYKHYVSVFELTFFNNPNYIVEQFTGLYDESGKEIYEGDIVTGVRFDDEIVEYEADWQANLLFLKENGFLNSPIKIIGNVNRDNATV